MPVASGSIAYLGAARFQGLYQASNNFGTGSGLSGGVTGAKQGLFSTGSSTGGGYAAAIGLTASAGDYWQISSAGSHNVDGETTWRLNDWCIYSGSAGGSGTWKKLSFEDTIASIVVGDLSSSSFHMGAENDKHIIFNSGSVHTGSSKLVFDYTNDRFELNGDMTFKKASAIIRSSGGSNVAQIVEASGIRILDGQKALFGSGDDSFIMYRETGDDFMVISGSSAGVAISGTIINNVGKVGINNSSPKTALSVVHNYDSGSAGTKFEDQLSDNEGGGKILKYGAGSLTAGKLYYLGTDSNWAQVDADAVASGASQLLGVAMGTSPTSNGLLLAGFFKVASGNVEGTAVVGAAVYASEEPGKFDFTAPSASNDFVHVVGYCADIDSSDILLYFNPDSTFVEIA